jgi:predicted kinase
LRQRTGDITDATVDLLASQQAAWEDFTPAERADLTTVDTTQDVSELLAQLVQSSVNV